MQNRLRKRAHAGILVGLLGAHMFLGQAWLSAAQTCYIDNSLSLRYLAPSMGLMGGDGKAPCKSQGPQLWRAGQGRAPNSM